MASFTSGKFARAMCDRCGHEIPYLDLKDEWTGLKVCKACWDPKTAIEFPSNFPSDPEALHDPRPDNDIEASNGYVNISNQIGSSFKSLELGIELGDVTTTLS